MIQFELIFVFVESQGLKVIPTVPPTQPHTHRYPVVLALFVEKTILSSLNYPGTFWKVNSLYLCGLFQWPVCLILYKYYTVLNKKLYIIIFEIKQCFHPTLCFPFKIALAILSLLYSMWVLGLAFQFSQKILLGFSLWLF